MMRGLRVLLVEDEPVDVMTVRRAIRMRALAIELEVAESAEDGLRLLEQRDSTGNSAFDLIIADLHLPQLSGLDLLERVKCDTELRRIPYVMLTTSAQEVEVANAYELGAAGYFVKPVSFDEYAEIVEHIFGCWSRTQAYRSPGTPAPARAVVTDMHYLEFEFHSLLRSDESLFDSLEGEVTDGLWYWDLENPEHRWMSPRFWRTLGFDPATKPHLTSAWHDIIDPGDLAIATSNFEKHCADPAHAYDQVVRYVHKDGSTVWIRCRGVAIRDRDGVPIRMLGVHMDVTDQKLAEKNGERMTARLDAIEALFSEESAGSSAGRPSADRLLDDMRSILEAEVDS